MSKYQAADGLNVLASWLPSGLVEFIAHSENCHATERRRYAAS